MRFPTFSNVSACAILVFLTLGSVSEKPAFAQSPPPEKKEEAPSTQAAVPENTGASLQDKLSSTEQGQTSLTDTFDLDWRQWLLEKRRDALRDTQFKFNLRAYYFDREKYDRSESESFAIGGWAGLKTGYFLDHFSLGATGYTSQHLFGDDDKDGALLLAPGQEGYSMLGELYADIKIIDDLNLYVGRKEFDTPFINRNDTRMTPNTFEAIVLQGRAKIGENGATLKYGLGYFDRIKDRNSEEFVSMSEDAGAEVERGVFTAGGLYQKGDFSFGAIDYYSPDIINIGYAEAKLALPIGEDWKPRLALQFTDQRSVGDDLLQDESFSTQQFGIKAELPVGPALFTTAYTHNSDGSNVQNPWSGYPGYTAVQVEDFNRVGEAALLLRAAYKFTTIDGLSAYALWVHGMDPELSDQYARDEYDINLEWAPTKGWAKGLSLRLRYAIVDQHGGDSERLKDFRVICNYAINF